MKRYITTSCAFGAVIIATIAVMMFLLHGLAGAILYLLFAAICLTPAALKAREIFKREKRN
ncbi:MAG: hypothetical protein HDS68_02465 [Bacteroidales bacterium]|nr:hypothetical protein [Bacteroidales bacterium]